MLGAHTTVHPEGQVSELAFYNSGKSPSEGKLQSSDTRCAFASAAAEPGIKLESPGTSADVPPADGRLGQVTRAWKGLQTETYPRRRG